MLTTAMLTVACGADVSAKLRAPVASFRQALATGDAQVVSRWVRYPLPRPYPLPPVGDAQNFVERFDELFPEQLVADVAASKDDDWQRVGWRGVMFGNGRLWIDDELRLSGHNESSQAEDAHRSTLIERDRRALAESLQGHGRPVLRWQTKTYRVRIDRMPDEGLRYTSWRREAPLNATPDLQLFDGKRVFEGSGGNEHYDWRNGKHSYHCELTPLGGRDSMPLALVVRRGDKVLLAEEAVDYYP